MQFGFERSSNVGKFEFRLHVWPGRHMRWLHFSPLPFFSPSYGKGTTISGVASVFPTLHLQQVSSLRPQTDTLKPSRAGLFKWLHLVQMKGEMSDFCVTNKDWGRALRFPPLCNISFFKNIEIIFKIVGDSFNNWFTINELLQLYMNVN